MGTQLPPQKKGGIAPNIRPMSIVAKRLGRLRCQLVVAPPDATEYGGRPRPRRHCVRWGPSSYPSKKGHTPKFSAHVCCGQMLRCIRIPLCTEVGLTPGDIVLDGDPAPPKKWGIAPNIWPMSIVAKRLGGLRCQLVVASPKKGDTVPIFGPCLLWPNDRMDQDATEYGGRPQPRRHCVTWGPSCSPSKKGHTPKFSAHVYCGQMLRCIRIPFHTEVGLTLGETVLDGDPAAPYKGHIPHFWAHVYCGQTAGWSRCHLVRR